jgi:hypothetical protein
MNLKTKQSGEDQEFAYLIVPSTPVNNDDELYAAVRQEGRAVLRPFEGHSLMLKLPVEMTPDEFEKKWQGD